MFSISTGRPVFPRTSSQNWPPSFPHPKYSDRTISFRSGDVLADRATPTPTMRSMSIPVFLIRARSALEYSRAVSAASSKGCVVDCLSGDCLAIRVADRHLREIGRHGDARCKDSPGVDPQPDARPAQSALLVGVRQGRVKLFDDLGGQQIPRDPCQGHFGKSDAPGPNQPGTPPVSAWMRLSARPRCVRRRLAGVPLDELLLTICWL